VLNRQKHKQVQIQQLDVYLIKDDEIIQTTFSVNESKVEQ
jgi:hypothetical protein